MAGIAPFFDNPRNTEIKIVSSFILFLAFFYAWFDYFRTLLSFKRFGEAFCELTPFPGKIGGQVTGKVFLGKNCSPTEEYELSLKYNKKGFKWSICDFFEAKSYSEGVFVNFTFDVPIKNIVETTKLEINFSNSKVSTIPIESDFLESSLNTDTHLWTLSICAKSEQGKLFREFNIPVFNQNIGIE